MKFKLFFCCLCRVG